MMALKGAVLKFEIDFSVYLLLVQGHALYQYFREWADRVFKN